MSTKRMVYGALFAATLAVTGCATPVTKQDIGTVTGAVVGGVAGSAITGGSTAGTVGGAALGGYIGNRVGKGMDDRH